VIIERGAEDAARHEDTDAEIKRRLDELANVDAATA